MRFSKHHNIHWSTNLGIAALSCFVFGCVLAMASDDNDRRVKPPQFDREKISNIFFDDVFEKLNGERPTRIDGGNAATPSPGTTTPMPGGENVASNSEWASLISDASLEDEVKAIRMALDDSVTTPGKFRSGGHKAGRRDFVLLTVMFWVIEHYSKDVRWKGDSVAARQLFGSVAGNSKAGGNEQVYTQAKRCKDKLARLLQGEKLGIAAVEDDGTGWEPVSPRTPLMQLLEKRFQVHLKTWTSSESEFKGNAEDLIREAELVAVIANFLNEEGMPDRDDDEYRAFTVAMTTGAKMIADAARQEDLTRAQKGAGIISQACTQCHESYR